MATQESQSFILLRANRGNWSNARESRSQYEEHLLCSRFDSNAWSEAQASEVS